MLVGGRLGGKADVRRRRSGVLAILAALCVTSLPAHAQRASENAVTAANDAFGTTVGNESVGIYSTFDVRGFSPLQAGNVRIDGLYFDKVGDENDRIQESSRIKVGIAAQGYAFPAPSGIVDYSLRTPGNAGNLSVLGEGDSAGFYTLQLDGAAPLGRKLSLGGGIGLNRGVFPDGGNNYEGEIGVLAKWQPLPDLEIIPFWARKDTYVQKDGQAYEPSSDFLPSPVPPRHFYGPAWATGRDFSVNYGAVVHYTWASWSVGLGLFRSERSDPKGSFPYLSLVTPAHGEMAVDLNPPAHLGSTSGELRVEKSFIEGPRVHRLILSVRGRNWNGIYGNSQTVDVGPQTIGQFVRAPTPHISFAPLIHDHVDESLIGVAYQLAWKDRLELSLGAQKLRYHKKTLAPGTGTTLLDKAPVVLTASGTGYVSDTVALFASFTQGLEDNGITPSNAANSNQALPATSTRQKEAGLRWTVMPQTNFVATLFDLKKPYFNLDPDNVFRELGELENKGLELSLTGNVTDRLNLVAGAVLSHPKVSGDAVRLGVSGHRPVGIRSRKFVLAANWRPPGTKGLSFDLGVTHFGSQPGSLDDAVNIPVKTTIDWDARYEFAFAQRNASLKFAVTNITGVRGFNVIDSGTYGIFFASGRRFDLRLIVDI